MRNLVKTLGFAGIVLAGGCSGGYEFNGVVTGEKGMFGIRVYTIENKTDTIMAGFNRKDPLNEGDSIRIEYNGSFEDVGVWVKDESSGKMSHYPIMKITKCEKL